MKTPYEKLLEAATPLPYVTDPEIKHYIQDKSHNPQDVAECNLSSGRSKANAQLLTHSANVLPQALKSLKDLVSTWENEGAKPGWSKRWIEAKAKAEEVIEKIENPEV